MKCPVCGANHAACGTPYTGQPINLEQLRMASNHWVSDRRLYLNAAGQAVEADAPDRVTLLVAAGGRLPLADAERLGLLPVPEPAEPEKAKAVPANKARKAGANK